jgi:hypothetical protein
VTALGCLLAACGDGGSGDSSNGGTGPVVPPPAGNVTISGTISYDFVPAGPTGGLNYGATESRPARQLTVQFVEGTRVLASASTDDNGEYSLLVPRNRTGFVRARAESVRSGALSWNFRVLDNINGDALYTLDGSPLSSGTANSRRDLHADSGWTGADYGDERAAAPFAVLDTILIGAEFLSSSGVTSLPALDIHWSTENVSVLDEQGDPDPATGEIGSSFYGRNTGLGISGIYLLGKAGSDTEEYDRHVILHEFGHYLEASIGRSDSIGGPHARGDALDPRVAFSEGWGTAFAALALGDPVYRDTGGFRQSGAFSFNVESPGPSDPNPAPGWYSEESVWELLYDLVDTDIDGADLLSYPVEDLWSIMSGRVVTTPSLVTIFPFLNAFATAHATDETLLDQLLASQSIDPVDSDFAIAESNDAGSIDALPLYSDLTVNGPAVTVCSTDEFTSNSTGAVNKLASRRFIRFTPPAAGTVNIAVTATSIPDGEYSDPDWIVHRFNPIWISDDAPTAACQDVNSAGWNPGLCVEPDPANGAASVPVLNAEHILEVYEWTHTIDSTEFPPIGRTCFNVAVTQ